MTAALYPPCPRTARPCPSPRRQHAPSLPHPVPLAGLSEALWYWLVLASWSLHVIGSKRDTGHKLDSEGRWIVGGTGKENGEASAAADLSSVIGVFEGYRRISSLHPWLLGFFCFFVFFYSPRGLSVYLYLLNVISRAENSLGPKTALIKFLWPVGQQKDHCHKENLENHLWSYFISHRPKMQFIKITILIILIMTIIIMMLFCHCEIHEEQTRQEKPQGQVSQAEPSWHDAAVLAAEQILHRFCWIFVLRLCAPCTDIHFWGCSSPNTAKELSVVEMQRG